MTEKSRLRIEAEQVIEDLDIMGLLNAYGNARIVGSVALDLIVKRDIDIHVLVLLRDTMDMAQHLMSVLLKVEGVNEVTVKDYRERASLKVGVDEFMGESGPWSIDIWLTTDVSTTGFALADEMEVTLDEDMREVILSIKRHYHIRDLLQNGLSGLIYRAVTEGRVQNANEFEQWLARTQLRKQDRESILSSLTRRPKKPPKESDTST
ncbi:MAG: hypothetical protein ACW975_06900 [Candidatus Thorarchaeota archaeon]|jgi:hypothetical protein